jgi:metallo-beta-lactamase family protein
MHLPRQKATAPTGRTLLKQHALGAAHAVTGSLFLYEYFSDGKITRWLLDVGLTVEDQAADFQKRLPAGITAADINFVIISHAHVDHCGYLPKLIKDGFKGKVFVTHATMDLMTIILPDSGHLQEEAAKRQNKRLERHRAMRQSGQQFNDNRRKQNNRSDRNFRQSSRSSARSGNAESQRFFSLYTQEEATAALKFLVPVDYHVRRRVNPDIAFTFTDAGHILGSAVVNMEVGSGNQKRTICFTGNVGRRNMPLLRDVEPIQAADHVMLEATYGNKLHLKRDRLVILAETLNGAHKRAKKFDPQTGCGVILIPSFAVGRGQTVLNDIRILMESGRVPTMPVYVDGNMTNAATEIYKKYPTIMNDETRKLLEAGKDPYATPKHNLCRDWTESEALRQPHKEPIIIVGSSGMASGGRIVDHLKYWLPGRKNTVVFVGYQGVGTLGQAIVSTSDANGRKAAQHAPKTVKISGKPVSLAAKIEFVPDYSAHADYEDQLAWLKKFKRQPKRVYIVHGDEDGLVGLKGHIEKTLGWKNVIIPSKGQVFEL